MKKLIALVIALAVTVLAYYQEHLPVDDQPPQNDSRALQHTPRDVGSASNAAAEQAIKQRRSDVQLEMHGVVKKLLSDDNNGSRHQRFIVELSSGDTILVAHNIDLAERVSDLRAGDDVGLYGEYVWNERGGVMHWTHRDPAGRHVAGWIKHNSRVYQ